MSLFETTPGHPTMNDEITDAVKVRLWNEAAKKARAVTDTLYAVETRELHDPAQLWRFGMKVLLCVGLLVGAVAAFTAVWLWLLCKAAEFFG